jgi:hypothetical protein
MPVGSDQEHQGHGTTDGGLQVSAGNSGQIEGDEEENKIIRE